MTSNIVRFDKLRAMPFAQITNSYQAIGFLPTPTTPAPFTHAMRVLHFVNNTNGDMLISFDGTNDNVPLLAESFALYDLTSDEDFDERFRYVNGTQIYIKYITAPTAPADGAVYLVAVYGLGE